MDLCSWHQDYDDQFDWSLRNDGTGGANKGPLNDHSVNSFNGYYLYIDSSWPRQFGDIARISSVAIRASNQFCAVSIRRPYKTKRAWEMLAGLVCK